MYQTLPVLVMVMGAWGAAPWKDVLTTQGVVRGYLVDHHQEPYYAYRAIFYARAKQHRFKAPRPAKRWDGIFEATYQVKCPQPDGSGTEDCLVLNVFSPHRASLEPVLVVVHDGNFHSGWGAFQPPTRLLAHNFVTVTFNYRLGSLGFLCLNTPEAPGNAGLKDQVAALYWIQKNIENFGGNPSDVTVYGVGSGATSIQLILLSGAAKGLLHKAILESGSAMSPLSLSYDPILTAFDAAVSIGYTGTDNANELAKFYKSLSVKSLINTSSIFLPCLEKYLHETHSLLELDPIESYEQKNYQAVPMIIAYTSTLGATEADALPNNLENLLPSNLQFDNENLKQRVSTIVQEFYFGTHGQEENSPQNYIEYLNDVTNEYPIIKSTVLHAATSNAPTYVMKLLNKEDTKNVSGKSVCCKYIFDYFYDKDSKGKDNTKVERLVTLWSNFIRIGDPTPLTSSLVPVLWQPVEVEKDNFDITSVTGLVIGKTLQANSDLAHNKILFWDQIYKKFYRLHLVYHEDDEIIV